MVFNTFDYNAIKRKLSRIANTNLCKIIDNSVLTSNSLIFEGLVLFNLLIFYYIDNDIPFHIDTTLIRRCIQKVLHPNLKLGRKKKTYKKNLKLKNKKNIDKENDNKNIDKENDNKKFIEKFKIDSLSHIDTVFTDRYNVHIHKTFEDEKCITGPVETFSNTFDGNITVHCSSKKFFNFQKRYFAIKIKKYINKYDLSEKQLDPILYAIQKSIHLNIPLEIVTKKISNEILIILNENLQQFVKDEQKNIPKEFLVKMEDIGYDEIENEYGFKKDFREYFSDLMENNRETVLKYYYFILKNIKPEEKEYFKGFSILPQKSICYNHITFDKRSMSSLYNKWKKETNKNFVDIPIKTFESEYNNYFNKMFNLKDTEGRLIKKYGIPSIINTDGYSISIMFRKKKAKKQKKEKREKKATKIHLDASIKLGIYNANNIEVDKNFLENYNVIKIDPGVKYLIQGISCSNKRYSYSKREYYDKSHTNINMKKKKKLMEENGIDKINDELSKTTVNTYDQKIYMEYINILRNHWDKLWNFYGLKEWREMKYDSFVNKKVAVNDILKTLIPRKRKKGVKGETEKEIKIKDPYFNYKKYKEDKEKPILIAMGNGNGKMTVNNVRNSGPKGPVKKLIEELSKRSLVIIVDEYLTSQICSLCYEEKVDYIEVIEKPGRKKRVREEKKKLEDDKYKTTEERIKKKEELEKQKEEAKKKTEIKRIEKEIKELKIKNPSHEMCSCKNEKHGHRMLARNYNSARNIGEVMRRKLNKEDLGKFKRSASKEIKNKAEGMCENIITNMQKISEYGIKKKTKERQPKEQDQKKIIKKIKPKARIQINSTKHVVV